MPLVLKLIGLYLTAAPEVTRETALVPSSNGPSVTPWVYVSPGPISAPLIDLVNQLPPFSVLRTLVAAR